MKLRLEKGVIKCRLSADEIDRLNTEKKLTEKIFLSDNNQFTYTVSVHGHEEKCTAQFEQYSLMIIIPSKKAEKWMNSRQVGIKETIVTDRNETYSLTLEEDLPPRKNKR